MESQVVEGKSLPYVLVKPPGFKPGAGWPLVVLVHGRGASMYDLAGLAPVIDDTGYVYAFPNGPYSFYGMGSQLGRRPARRRYPLPEGAPSVTELFNGFMAEVMRADRRRSRQHRPRRLLAGRRRHPSLRPAAPRDLQGPDGPQRRLPRCRPRGAAGRAHPADLRRPRHHDQVLEVEMGRQTAAYLEENGYAVTYKEYPMATKSPREESTTSSLAPRDPTAKELGSHGCTGSRCRS